MMLLIRGSLEQRSSEETQLYLKQMNVYSEIRNLKATVQANSSLIQIDKLQRLKRELSFGDKNQSLPLQDLINKTVDYACSLNKPSSYLDQSRRGSRLATTTVRKSTSRSHDRTSKQKSRSRSADRQRSPPRSPTTTTSNTFPCSQTSGMAHVARAMDELQQQIEDDSDVEDGLYFFDIKKCAKPASGGAARQSS